MADYLMLMHNDLTATEGGPEAWEVYIADLVALGRLQGGSVLGAGICLRKGKRPRKLSAGISGYIKVEAEDLSHARRLISGNPVYEAGGTVEIRELLAD